MWIALVTYSDGQHGGAAINGEGTRKSESAGCVCMLDRRQMFILQAASTAFDVFKCLYFF